MIVQVIIKYFGDLIKMNIKKGKQNSWVKLSQSFKGDNGLLGIFYCVLYIFEKFSVIGSNKFFMMKVNIFLLQDV